MKKGNNKGFTLIELLAVVVILLAITVIAISSISAAMERNKAKQDAKKIEIIESSAELYYNEHKNTITSSRNININNLGLSDEERTDANGDKICGNVYITIANGGATFKFTRGNC